VILFGCSSHQFCAEGQDEWSRRETWSLAKRAREVRDVVRVAEGQAYGHKRTLEAPCVILAVADR